MKKTLMAVLVSLLLFSGCGGYHAHVQTKHMENGDTCYVAYSSGGTTRGISCTK